MKISINIIFLFFVLFGSLISIMNISCTSINNNQNNPDSLTLAVMKRSTQFNPDYFRESANYHLLLKVKYENGVYKLADNHIFKVPGKYRFQSTSGNFM